MTAKNPTELLPNPKPKQLLYNKQEAEGTSFRNGQNS